MPETTNITGIEQGRAKFAYDCALAGSKLEKVEKRKEYKSYVKKTPMMIKTNGIGSTFAFMFSKGGTYVAIGENILEWLSRDTKSIIDLAGIDNFSKLTKKTVELNSVEYRALTNEVLAFLSWLKRFSDGLIEGE